MSRAGSHGASVAQSSEQVPFTSESWVRFSLRTHVKTSQRSAESRGFSPGVPVSSHRESCEGGLG